MVYDSLILMYLYPNVSVGLSRDCPRLDKVTPLLYDLIIRVVASLRRGHILLWRLILFFLASAHRLVIELPALFLELVVAHVKSVSAKAVIAHFTLIIIGWALAEDWLLLKPVSCVIIVDVVWIILGV